MGRRDMVVGSVVDTTVYGLHDAHLVKEYQQDAHGAHKAYAEEPYAEEGGPERSPVGQLIAQHAPGHAPA